MIFTDRIITVRKGESKINEPIIVYRGDYELEVRFTIMNSKFKFMSGTNLIESENAAYGQLAILTPYGGNIFSEVAKCNDGTVTFVLTEEMLDQIEEVGLYSFQIRLFDYIKESRVSIPPVEFGIEVREPITSEDHDNSVNNAIVGYSIAKITDALNETVPDTFNSYGDYNKTIWETGDRITEGKLNKIEDAIDTINQNEQADIAALDKRITSNYNVLDTSKADKNEVFSMKNMGQDIREAMTGGSVAVVGENTILSENIVDGQVTLSKVDFIEGGNLCDNSEIFNWYISGGMIQTDTGIVSHVVPIINGNTYHIQTVGIHNRLRLSAISDKSVDATGTPLYVDNDETDGKAYSIAINSDYPYMLIQVSNSGQRPIVIVENTETYLTINKKEVITKDKINSVSLSMIDGLENIEPIEMYQKTNTSLNVDASNNVVEGTTKTISYLYDTSSIDPQLFTIQTEGAHNRFIVGLINDIEVGSIFKSLYKPDQSTITGNMCVTFTNIQMENYKYLIVYVCNDGIEPTIAISNGETASSESKTTINGKSILFEDNLNDAIKKQSNIIDIHNIAFMEYTGPIEGELVSGLMISVNSDNEIIIGENGISYVYPTNILKDTFTVKTIGSHNRFAVVLSDNLEDETVVDVLVKEQVTGNIERTFNDVDFLDKPYLIVYVSNSDQQPIIILSNGEQAIEKDTVYMYNREIAYKSDIEGRLVTYADIISYSSRITGISLNMNAGANNIIEGDDNCITYLYNLNDIPDIFTVHTEGLHNRIGVYLSNDVTANTSVRVLHKESHFTGNFEMSFDITNFKGQLYQYLMIYVTNSGVEPEFIGICQGDSYKETGVYYNDSRIVTYDDMPDVDMSRCSLIYKNNIIQETTRTTHLEVYSDYDELVASYPEYVSKNVLGTDAIGNEIIEYVFGSPNYNEYDDNPRAKDPVINKPVLLMATGIHGSERSPVLGVYRFLKDLCDGNCNELVSMLRDSIIIKVLPTCNPSGYDANTRQNHNKVNLNRNFTQYWTEITSDYDYSGTGPASELETQIMEQWMKDNSDAAYYIDWHNTGYTDSEIVYFAAARNTDHERDTKDRFLRFLDRISNYWRQDRNIPANRTIGYTGTFGDLAMAYTQADATGLKGICMEVSQQMPGDSSAYGPKTVTMCAETCGNFLVELFKR